MRLLNSTTLKFVNLEGPQIPPYAILSHTWGREEDEVSFQELRDGLGSSKPGYEKIRGCAQRAREHGYEFFWADTCCIDKSSSAELTEAINSMYAWYKNATICYAYLSDVSSPHPVFPPPSTFKSSKWFTRGWTLQELIAPRTVVFLSKEWQRVGEKANLKEAIQEITGIRTNALDGADLGLFSVSERMSWASKRQTTRVEDVAYSLMGLFDVNMPLLYGEKEKSFIRLQEEIMKTSDDQSLFAWMDKSSSPTAYHGLLARSPNAFIKSANISSLGIWSRSDAFVMTNKGLRAELFLIPHPDEEELYLASLDCLVEDSPHKSPAIYLKRVSGREDNGISNSLTQFARTRVSRVEILGADKKLDGVYRTIYVRQSHVIPLLQLRSSGGLKLFRIRKDCKELHSVQPADQWNPQSEILSTRTASGGVAAVFVAHESSFCTIILGIAQQGTPWVHIVKELSDNPFQSQDWRSYRPTGREGATSREMFESSETQMGLGVRIDLREVYMIPVFDVWIKLLSMPIAKARALEWLKNNPEA